MKNDYYNLLLDFYAELLNQNQKEIMFFYYREDLSLSEISENKMSSRSNIFEIIKRSEKKLIEYENKLGLLKKYQLRNEIYDKIESSQDLTLINELRKLEGK